MKRLISAWIVLSVMLMLPACVAGNPPEPSASGYDVHYGNAFSSSLPAELQQFCAPWTNNAPQEGKLHYYFMSGKGMLMDPQESDPYKWGDSTLIVFPGGETMLIDVGMQAYAPVLAENLKRLGIERLDFLMLSHPHGDHIGGVIAQESFLDMIGVDTVLYSGIDRNESSDLIYTRCAERNIPIQILKKGDVLEFGAVRMEVLWPMDGTDGKKITKTEAINNHSIVVRFDYHTHSSLFVGDLYVSGEAMVINECWSQLDADLLKVPHHGYTTSNSGLFIEMVSPELAVAMSGYRPIVQRAYESRGVTFLYDRYEGYIHVITDGSSMTYDTERNM